MWEEFIFFLRRKDSNITYCRKKKHAEDQKNRTMNYNKSVAKTTTTERKTSANQEINKH